MTRRYEGEDDGDYVDRVTDDDIQRGVDDKWEAEREAKKRASGISADDLSLLQAFSAGQKAGMNGWGPNMNDYQEGTPEFNEWERARTAVIGARLNSGTFRRVA